MDSIGDELDAIKNLLLDIKRSLEGLTIQVEQSVTLQGNSLPMGILKDVLLPIIFKLFTFFALLVVGLLGTIIGIKWIAIDFLKVAGG